VMDLRPSHAPSTSSPGFDGVEAEPPYKMKDLCALTGLERQTIHFYIHEGLVPEGKKTGRNQAEYGREHLERLRFVKRLQEERMLPLRAIRAVLDGQDASFTPAQQDLLLELKRHLVGSALDRSDADAELVPIALAARASGVPVREVQELVSLGLLAATRGSSGPALRREDLWLVEAWGDLRRAGIDAASGFGPRDLLFADEAVGQLIEKEKELFLERLGGRSPAEVAKVLERSLPVMERLVARLHTKKAREFFASLGEAAPSPERAPKKARRKP